MSSGCLERHHVYVGLCVCITQGQYQDLVGTIAKLCPTMVKVKIYDIRDETVKVAYLFSHCMVIHADHARSTATAPTPTTCADHVPSSVAGTPATQRRSSSSRGLSPQYGVRQMNFEDAHKRDNNDLRRTYRWNHQKKQHKTKMIHSTIP